MAYTYEDYIKSAEYIRARAGSIPKTAVVLGSGLGEMTRDMTDAAVIDYKDIPNFPLSTAPSHDGRMFIDGNMIALSGRFHYYEGYTMEQAAYYVRVLKLLGVQSLILTNAAGGINTEFSSGALMMITDHIKFFDESPLRGANMPEFGVRFPDMTKCYSDKLQATARKTAEKLGIELRSGVYAFMPGPSYETPAEIRALRILGADAVGMSTVPEAIAARHAGLDILAVSCITNMAAGITGEQLTEEEVIETANRIKGSFGSLVRGVVRELA